MKITKGRLKEIIQEELSRVPVEEGERWDRIKGAISNINKPSYAPNENSMHEDLSEMWGGLGDEIVGVNPSFFEDEVFQREYTTVSEFFKSGVGSKEEALAAIKAAEARLGRLIASTPAADKSYTPNTMWDKKVVDGSFWRNFSDWVKKLEEPIEEGLFDKANQTVGLQGHEPEESPTITVTEEELIEARHAAYYLIKGSLESGADSVSLEETVRKVYGYNVPSYILELFSDEE